MIENTDYLRELYKVNVINGQVSCELVKILRGTINHCNQLKRREHDSLIGIRQCDYKRPQRFYTEERLGEVFLLERIISARLKKGNNYGDNNRGKCFDGGWNWSPGGKTLCCQITPRF